MPGSQKREMRQREGQRSTFPGPPSKYGGAKSGGAGGVTSAFGATSSGATSAFGHMTSGDSFDNSHANRFGARRSHDREMDANNNFFGGDMIATHKTMGQR